MLKIIDLITFVIVDVTSSIFISRFKVHFVIKYVLLKDYTVNKILLFN